MTDQFSRSRLMYGDSGMDALSYAHVAVFGIGGVGGHVAEALVRTGIGSLDLIDHDTIDITNLNRQIIATHSTLGQSKVEAAKQRFKDINPSCRIATYDCFYEPETADQFDLSQYDYVIDAVDTVTAKLELITRSLEAGVPIISAMGAGNKTDPTALQIADISKTSVCPLARIMRKELRKRGIAHVKVCFSTEPPIEQKSKSDISASTQNINKAEQVIPNRRSTPGSNAFVPAAMGLALAAEVVKDLIAAGNQ